jgi:hypothetical protein
MPSRVFPKTAMVDLCQNLFELHCITPHAISTIGPHWKSSEGRWSRSRSKLNEAIPDGATRWYIAVYSDQWIDDWIYEKNLFRLSIEQESDSININLSTPLNGGVSICHILNLFVVSKAKNQIAAFQVDLPFELSPTGYLRGSSVQVFDRSFGEHTKADKKEITDARDWRWKHAYWRDGLRDIYPFMILSQCQRNLSLVDGQCLERLIINDSRMGLLETSEGIVSWRPTTYARDLLRRFYRPSWLGSSLPAMRFAP